MSVFTDEYRARGQEMSDASDTLLADAEIANDPQKLATAILGKGSANLYFRLADVVDYLESSSRQGAADDRLTRIRERNDQIRLAAAKGAASGDWSAFNRVAFGVGDEEGGGGD